MEEYTGLEVQHWITICVFSLKKCDYYMSQEINFKKGTGLTLLPLLPIR